MNYGELKTELRDIAKLSATSAVGVRVAKFITRAEGMIATRVRAVEMIETNAMVEANRVAAGGSIYNLPARCLDPIDISIAAAPPIIRRPLGDVLKFNTAGPMVHSYSTRGGESAGGVRVDFRAIPAANTAFSVLGFYRPTAMTLDADTRALLTNYETLYIHAALHWLYLDAHDSNLSAAHREGFLSEAADVNAVAKAALRAGSYGNLEYNHFAGSAM